MERRNFLKGLLGVAAAVGGIRTVGSELNKSDKHEISDLAFSEDEGLTAHYLQDVTPHNGVNFYGANDYVQVPELDTSEWKHIVYTKDEHNGAHLYINGEKVFKDRIVGFRAYHKVLTDEEKELLHKIKPNETLEIWRV